MSAYDKRAVLSQNPLFGGLPSDVIDRLVSYAHMKSFKAGATIFNKDDPGTSLFALCSGTVKISNRSFEGKDAVFNLLHAGEIFGEIALLDGRPRTAEAPAWTVCELWIIDGGELVPLSKSNRTSR